MWRETRFAKNLLFQVCKLDFDNKYYRIKVKSLQRFKFKAGRKILEILIQPKIKNLNEQSLYKSNCM